VDAAVAPARVQAVSALPGFALVGFDRYTPMQESLLERWAAAGVEVRRETPTSGPSGSTGRVACLDPAAEIDAAARWAAERLHGHADRRVAIVVPDLMRRRDDVRRRVERVLVPEAGLTGGPAPNQGRSSWLPRVPWPSNPWLPRP